MYRCIMVVHVLLWVVVSLVSGYTLLLLPYSNDLLFKCI